MLRCWPYFIQIAQFYLFWIGFTSTASLNCSLVRDLAERSGRFDLSTDSFSPTSIDVSYENICGATRPFVTCCSAQTQMNLMKRTTFELKQLVEKVNNQLVTYIQEKRHQLRDHLISHLMWTESGIHEMFEENFKIVARPVRNPVQNLFRIFSSYLRSEFGAYDPSIGFDSAKFEKSILKFYSSIFAPIFACVITQNCARGYALSKNYTSCIHDSQDSINPFGNAAINLASKLEKSLIFANTSLIILDELSDFINSTSSNLWTNFQSEIICQKRLYQLYYCQLCSGESNESTPEICPSVMTQVLDQCLNNFKRFDDMFHKLTTVFKTFARLYNAKQYDLEEKLIGMKYEIQDVILNVTLNGGPEISAAIYRRCGAVVNEDRGAVVHHKRKKLENGNPKPNEMRIRSVGSFKFSNEITVITQNLSLIAKNWFGQMLVNIYETSEVATNANGTCWNGHAFVRYSKSLETLASADGAAPQATSTLANNTELDEKYRRMSETLQTLEKLRSTDGGKMPQPVVNQANQPNVDSVMNDDGSGDSSPQNSPIITDDDDYSEASGNGPVSDHVSSGDDEGKITTRRPEEEIGLESLSPVSSKATTKAPKNIHALDNSNSSSSSLFHNKLSISTALFLVTFFHTVRWLLWRL